MREVSSVEMYMTAVVLLESMFRLKDLRSYVLYLDSVSNNFY